VTNLAAVKKNVEELADAFRKTQRERQLRRSLDPDDFDQLRRAGFHLTGVPLEQGGIRTDLSESTRFICEMLRSLARVDSSLALVASMHPTVMSFWTTLPTIASEHQAAWDKQTSYVIRRAMEGAWWGTITSENGTSGDVMLSKAVATPTGTAPGYRISGAKHFGSGSGMMQCMVTTAVAQGEQQPDWFIMEMPPQPWDGKNGARILAPWDGHGMTATQSHSVEFVDMPAERSAWPGHIDQLLGVQRGAVACMFTAVIVGIVDAAIAEAARKLKPGLDAMKAFDQVEWTRAQQEAWLVRQAMEGMLRAMDDPATSNTQALLGKISIAELADSIMKRISRVIGGGAYARGSPFGYWQQDVRALGYLRPPWGLSFERAFGLLRET
jgi:alkylation response protein AidB-like acyl-CoA dehydrogenase